MNNKNSKEILNQFKILMKKLNPKIFNVYEVEFLASLKNCKAKFLKQEKSNAYFTSDNIGLLNNILGSYGIYSLSACTKTKMLKIILSTFTGDLIKKRKLLFTQYIKEMFNNEIRDLNNNINSGKKNIKNMSDYEISDHKKNIQDLERLKKDFQDLLNRF